MPTLLRSGPYRPFIYSPDRGEPPHVHVDRERYRAKFWLDQVQLEDGGGFSRVELGRIEKLVAANAEQLLRGWHAFFGTENG